jgi:hypothetical protein
MFGPLAAGTAMGDKDGRFGHAESSFFGRSTGTTMKQH